MKTRKKSLFILSILACLITIISSCNKSDNLVWEGQVLEYGTNKPVNNATLVLYRGIGEILGGVSFEAIDTFVTGADGKYKFKFLDGPYGYEIRSKAHLYYDGVHAQNTINSGKTKKDLILNPHAWLRIHVENVNPVGEYDAIGFESFSCDSEGFVGAQIDTFSTCLNRGNRSHDMYYIVSKIGSGSNRLKLTYTLGAHDTTNILLQY